MIKKTAVLLASVFILLNIIIGLLGISSILLTISVYISIWFIFRKLIDKFYLGSNDGKNYQLFLLSLIISLFAAEVVLKYVTKSNLTYSEKNGEFFYNSLYKVRTLENFRQRYILKRSDIQTSTHPSNTCDFIRKPEFAYTHTYNSLGLRERELISDTSKITIIALGDSFTEGVGTPQDSTWIKLLEDNLNRYKPIKKILTINAGQRGSDPIAEFLLLERQLIKYNPKIVIVCINTSDVTDLIIRGGKERFRNGTVEYKAGPWWEFFYSYSYLFRSIMHSFMNINYLLITEKQYEFEKNTATIKLKESILTDYKNLARKQSFKLVVVLHPMQWDLENNYFMLNDLSSELKRDTTIETINLLDEFYAYQKNGKYKFKDLYWQIDLHHNSYGYKLWADILTRKIYPLLK